MFFLVKRISYAVIVACGIAFHAVAVAAPTESFEIPLAHQANLSVATAIQYTNACVHEDDLGATTKFTRKLSSGFDFVIIQPEPESDGMSFLLRATHTMLKRLLRVPLSSLCDIEMPETESSAVEHTLHLKYDAPPVALYMNNGVRLAVAIKRRSGKNPSVHITVEGDTALAAANAPAKSRTISESAPAKPSHPLELQVVHRRDDTSGQATYVIALLEPISQDSPMIYALDGIEASAQIKDVAQAQFDVSFRFNSSRVPGRSAIRYTAAVGEIVTLPQLDGSNVYLKLVENRR